MSKKTVDSVIDGHKFHLHPTKVALWERTGDCYPIHIEIGATARCNQKCVFCALDWVEHKKDIDSDIMLSALEDIAHPKIPYKITFESKNKNLAYYDRVTSVMFGGEGEPLLHKDIGLFIQKAEEEGLDVALTTNGVGFNKKLQEQCLPYLSWVKISVDAGNAEVYSKIHGTKKQDFNKLMNNIKQAVKLKKERNLESTIGTQFLVLPQNIESAEELAKKLSKIGVDYLTIKPYSHHPSSNNDFIIDDDDYNSLKPEVTKYSNDNFQVLFRELAMKRIREGNNYQKCEGLPFVSLIDSKANILPCNLFYNNQEFTYGNLYENSFSEIWNGDKRKNILSKLKTKGVKGCRKGCRCDAGNRYLDRLRNPQPHDNFT